MSLRYEKLKNILSEFEIKINYSFKDKNNLVQALTHSSYANESKNKKLQSNERFEFLGDAILNITISERLFLDNPAMSEGDLTRIRAAIVCESSLMKCSKKIGLGDYLLLGKGEELTGGRNRVSILSDAFEALIGAIYLDSSIEKAKEFILRNMNKTILDSVNGSLFMDFKTQLQEEVQKNGEKKISYDILEEKGPDHDKIFIMQVLIEDAVMGIGKGRTKKEAEQNAAKYALENHNF